MRRAHLTPLILVLAAGATAIWISRAHSAGTGTSAPVPSAGATAGAPAAPAAGARPSGAPPAGERADARPEEQRASSEPEPTVEVPAAPVPSVPGAGVEPILGGEAAFVEFYRTIDTDGRRSRVAELDTALATYAGDPQDSAGFEKYQALKDEAHWLREHPDP